MIDIDLASVPHQSFSITIDNHFYQIAIDQIAGEVAVQNGVVTAVSDVVMASTLSIDGILIQSGMRIVPGMPLMPYLYEEIDGNFILLTDNDDYPDYTQFGTNQFLVYASPSELEIIRSTYNAGTWPKVNISWYRSERGI